MSLKIIRRWVAEGRIRVVRPPGARPKVVKVSIDEFYASLQDEDLRVLETANEILKREVPS